MTSTVEGSSSEYGEFPLRRYLRMDVDDDDVGGELVGTAHLVIGPEHLNPNEVAHGAVLFALVDTAMGKATMNAIEPGRFCASIEVSLRFIRPASAGDLTTRATVVKRGNSVVHLEARVIGDADRLVATATGTFAIIDL